MKSLLVSVFWFAWMWTWRPESRWLCASYAQTLSTRDSRKCRQLITSPWYRETFGAITLVEDQNQKTRFENDRKGYRIATSVDGVGTGDGGDIIVVDDPHNVRQAESDAQRESAIDWWFETMSTRANNESTVVRVVVMQRINEADLSGEILSRDLGYEHLCIPARYEGPVKLTSLQERNPQATRDPRTVKGAPLHEARFDHDQLTVLERELGPYSAAGQLQQRPAPQEGGIFKANFFPIVPRPQTPPKAMRVRRWDLAAVDRGGDYTAGVLMAFYDDYFWIEDIVRVQLEPGARNALIRRTAEQDKATYGVVYTIGPQDPGAAGIDTAIAFKTLLQGFPCATERETGSKVVRAQGMSAQASIGRVKLYEGAWNRTFIDEAKLFPNGAHDDMIDAAAGAFNRILRASALTLKSPSKSSGGNAPPPSNDDQAAIALGA